MDCIVVGVGGAGSAALYHLARRGVRVLGLDRFAPGHAFGSSHGATRLIRLAYFEHHDYVPLLRRSFQLWEELGASLYTETGVVQIGPPDGEVVTGIRRAAAVHGLEVEERDRVPGLRIPDGMIALFERRAGLLAVESCVQAHATLAERHGAQLRVGETVRAWRADGDGVAVETDVATYRAQRLVITAGAWAGGFISTPLRVVRKSLFWHAADAGPEFPFYFELPHGHFYGFPAIDDLGVKLAEHTGGADVADPLCVDREIDAAEQARVADFVRDHVPGVSGPCTQHAVCFYTMTPDGHFVVDRHPEHGQVVFAAGLSGHGFKFAPVLGEVLADLALDGTTRHPVGFLALR